ncbi:MAG: hypothetical protein RPT25_06890 [Cycloclasticus sp.]
MISAQIFRETIVRPVLQASGTYSEAAEELMMGTVAHESDMGTYSVQQGIDADRAAQGFFQVERFTEADIWETYLNRKPRFKSYAMALIKLCPCANELLRENPLYSCFIARMKYWRSPAVLPAADDIQGLAEYWFDHYNGSPDNEREQKVAEFIRDYELFVQGE